MLPAGLLLLQVPVGSSQRLSSQASSGLSAAKRRKLHVKFRDLDVIRRRSSSICLSVCPCHSQTGRLWRCMSSVNFVAISLAAGADRLVSVTLRIDVAGMDASVCKPPVYRVLKCTTGKFNLPWSRLHFQARCLVRYFPVQ